MHSTIDRRPSRPSYWFFLIPFSICAVLGVAGIVTSDLLMPQNAAGQEGRLTIYRSMGTMSAIWASIVLWSWHQICLARVTKQRSDR